MMRTVILVRTLMAFKLLMVYTLFLNVQLDEDT